MELLVVRHAIAQDREEFAKTGLEDARRPLTDEGRRKFEKGARGLREVAGGIELLATSFLERHELARVVAEELGTEVKCMNAGIIAFDYNEIFRAQEHVVFLDDLLFLHPACHTNALR